MPWPGEGRPCLIADHRQRVSSQRASCMTRREGYDRRIADSSTVHGVADRSACPGGRGEGEVQTIARAEFVQHVRRCRSTVPPTRPCTGQLGGFQGSHVGGRLVPTQRQWHRVSPERRSWSSMKSMARRRLSLIWGILIVVALVLLLLAATVTSGAIDGFEIAVALILLVASYLLQRDVRRQTT
jgi:hypothetical protein